MNGCTRNISTAPVLPLSGGSAPTATPTFTPSSPNTPTHTFTPTFTPTSTYSPTPCPVTSCPVTNTLWFDDITFDNGAGGVFVWDDFDDGPAPNGPNFGWGPWDPSPSVMCNGAPGCNDWMWGDNYDTNGVLNLAPTLDPADNISPNSSFRIPMVTDGTSGYAPCPACVPPYQSTLEFNPGYDSSTPQQPAWGGQADITAVLGGPPTQLNFWAKASGPVSLLVYLHWGSAWDACTNSGNAGAKTLYLNNAPGVNQVILSSTWTQYHIPLTAAYWDTSFASGSCPNSGPCDVVKGDYSNCGSGGGPVTLASDCCLDWTILTGVGITAANLP